MPSNAGRVLEVGEGGGEAYVGSAVLRCGEVAGAAELFSAAGHVGQPAAALVVGGDPLAVVDDVDGQFIGDSHMDGQPGGSGVAHGVADGFGEDRCGVLGQFGADDAHRSRQCHRGPDVAVVGQLGDRGVDALTEILPGPCCGVQPENGVADVLDRKSVV